MSSVQDMSGDEFMDTIEWPGVGGTNSDGGFTAKFKTGINNIVLYVTKAYINFEPVWFAGASKEGVQPIMTWIEGPTHKGVIYGMVEDAAR